MEKSKINIVLIIVSFIVGMLVMFGISFLTKEKCEICEDSSNKNNTTQKDNIELSEENKKIFDYLNSIGTELYNNEKYKEYPDEQEGVYAVTYKDLIELGYDMSKFSNCDPNMNVIYFDPNKKLLDEYMSTPIQITIVCNTK